MKQHEEGHLGGYVIADENYPNGDPATYYPELWAWLITKLDIHSIADVGCGQGHSTKWFLEHGIDAIGIDGCNGSIIPENKFFLHDYTRGKLKLNRFFDLAWCCEFVEHIKEQYIFNFLNTFKYCNFIAMTHAFPGQGGFHHVNEQNSDYWIKLLEPYFKLDKKLTEESKSKVDGTQKYCHWYRSGLIFRKL